MKRVEKINSKKIKKIVKEHFSEDDFLLPENKIDSIIKEYLSKRIINEDDFVPTERKIGLNPKSKEVIEDIILNLNEIRDDLELIKEMESDVLIYENKYADEVIDYKLNELSKVIKGLEEIIEVTKNSNENPSI